MAGHDAKVAPAPGQAGGSSGEPLVILPGLLCDGRMFAGQVDAFDAHVIGDFYGPSRSIGAMAEFALARMPDRCALLGHSMGARVAFEVWRRMPGRISRLALADTGIHGVRPGEAAKRHALRELGRSRGAAALVDAWLPPMVGPSNRGDARLMAELRAMTIAAGVDVYDRQIAALLDRPETATVLRSIDCPAFVIVGEEDEWSPPAEHRRIADAIRNAQLRIVARAGHMAPAEQPARFNAILAEWLAAPASGIGSRSPQPLTESAKP